MGSAYVQYKSVPFHWRMFLRWNMQERHNDSSCASILRCLSEITPRFFKEVLNGIGCPSNWSWTRSGNLELPRGALTKTTLVLSGFYSHSNEVSPDLRLDLRNAFLDLYSASPHSQGSPWSRDSTFWRGGHGFLYFYIIWATIEADILLIYCPLFKVSILETCCDGQWCGCIIAYHSLGWTELAFDTKYEWLYLPLTKVPTYLWPTHETSFNGFHQHLQPHSAPGRKWKSWRSYGCYRRWHWRMQATLLLFVQSWRLQWYTWCIALITFSQTPRETSSQRKMHFVPCSP